MLGEKPNELPEPCRVVAAGDLRDGAHL